MRRTISLCCLTLLGSLSVASPIAWISNANATIDTVNVATNGSVLYGNTPFVTDSLARTNSGNLIIANGGGVLWDVTGSPVPIGATGKSQIGDLDYGNGGLWGYSNASQELFFYDLGLFAVTYSQVISIPSTATVEGVAFQQSTGDIYLSAHVGLNTDRLLHVPAFATSATLIGPMANSDPFSYFSDIDFDAAGTLYAVSFYHRFFYTVSTSNAATILISTGPHKDTTGMALNPVPEPATLACFVLGGLLLRRRKRKATS